MQFKKGFSLTEVLMAAGILVIGFMMIATVYPVGIKLAASATERTIGLVVAKEAKAKLKLYAANPLTMDFSRFRTVNIAGVDYNELMLFENVVGPGSIFFSKSHTYSGNTYHEGFYELLYPSLDYCDPGYYSPADQVKVMKYQTHTEDASYRWTALCVETGNPNEVETLILVTRKISKNAEFPIPRWVHDDPDYGYIDATLDPDTMSYPYTHPGYWPMPVRVDLEYDGYRVWKIDPADMRYINEGNTVIDSLYTAGVIEYFKVIDKDVNGIELDGDLWYDTLTGIATVWVFPPAFGSSRSPLVGVYSGGTIRFQ